MDPSKPVVIQSTSYDDSKYPASNVLILGEEYGKMETPNYWLADYRRTTGEGFTLKVDTCRRLVAGFQIKNKGNGSAMWRITREFQVLGSLNMTGPWEILAENELENTRGKPAPLLNYTFEKPVEIQFLKFNLVSYWGREGGGLQYFSAIIATGMQYQCMHDQKRCIHEIERWAYS